MTKVRLKEGPRAPLFYCAVVLACGSIAQAQTVDISRLEQCAKLDAADAKLACFEAIAAESQVAAEAAPEFAEESSREPTAEPATDSDVSLEPGPPANAPQESSSRQAASVSAAESPAIQAPVEEPVPIPAGADAAPAATGDGSFGGEYLESVEASRSKTMSAAVVDVTTTGYGELVFHLDNGQVWAQLEKRYFPYPRNQQFDIQISVGVLGEYQLQVGGTGRKVTVKRVK